MKNLKLFLGLVLIIIYMLPSFAQGDKPVLSASYFKERRAAFRNLMPENSVAVLFSYPTRLYSNDVDYPYHANPDLYYFTGYKEPGGMLLIFKEPQQFKGVEVPVNEIIFLPPVNPAQEKWTGKKLSYRDAMDKLGLQYALEANKFNSLPIEFANYKVIMLDILPEDLAESNNPSDLYHLVKYFKEKAGIKKNPSRMNLMFNEFTVQRNAASKKKLVDSLLNEHINFLRFDLAMTNLRVIKTPEELAVLQKAIDVSCAGHNEAMRSMNPEMSEMELQAIHEYIHKKGGAEFEGYPPIVASGNNGCILHYESNEAEHLGNGLVVMDVGAEYLGYSADVTRTAPSNGKFSQEQLIIYNIVLAASDSAKAAVKAGLPYSELDIIGQRVIANGLLKLGLIKKASEVGIYYPHGISHPIGLDVHDKYLMGAELKKNMVITIEPGIYIPEGSNCDKKWWAIGVRIEDDVLVLDDRGEVMSKASPVKPEEIEKLMRERSIFKN